MSIMGKKIPEFSEPVCISFRPKMLYDQLCYEVDPNNYKDKIDLKGKLALTMFIHYNEDRNFLDFSTNDENCITLNTIGISVN